MLEIGQVLWLKLPFGETDDISKIQHPYLIMEKFRGSCLLFHVGQMDTSKGKAWELAFGNVVPVDCENPHETVIYKPSFLQTDRKIQIEYFDGLEAYLDTTDTLSKEKLRQVVNKYYTMRNKYGADEFRDMYFKKNEIIELNPYEEWVVDHEKRLEKYGIHRPNQTNNIYISDISINHNRKRGR